MLGLLHLKTCQHSLWPGKVVRTCQRVGEVDRLTRRVGARTDKSVVTLTLCSNLTKEDAVCAVAIHVCNDSLYHSNDVMFS